MDLIIATALIVIAFLTTRLFFQSRVQFTIPGPKGLPILGNILQVRAAAKNAGRVVTLENFAKQYGPVFLVKVFSKPLVFISGYDEIIESIVTKGRVFGGRPQPYRLRLLFKGKDVLFGDPTTPQWVTLRKAAHRAVRHYGDGMNRLEHILANQMTNLVKSIKKHEGKEINLLPIVQSSIAQSTIIMQTCKAIEDDDDVIPYIQQLEMLRPAISPFSRIELDHMPWLRHFGHPAFKTIMRGIEILDELWDKFKAMAEDTYTSDGIPTCTINAILQLSDPKSQYYDPSIDKEYQKGLFLDLFLASMGSTVEATYAFFNVMLHHPQVLQKFRDEIDRVVGRDRMPSIKDKDSLPYVNATILEVMRYLSTVPLSGRWTLEDTSVGGHKIPQGTLVLPLYTALHHDDKFWGDPWTLRPERFLNADGSLVPADHPNRKHLMAFGAGIRVCCGEAFAMKRVFMFTASLVHAFDLQPGDKLVTCDPRQFKDGIVISQLPFNIKLIARHD